MVIQEDDFVPMVIDSYYMLKISCNKEWQLSKVYIESHNSKRN